MSTLRPCLALLLLGLGLAPRPAQAVDIGWRSDTLTAAAGRPEMTVALWYPAAGREAASELAMGPFVVRAALGAAAAARLRGLIVVSHGTGGTELGHGRLAEALAAQGYLVAALRHPGDNWRDDSLRTRRAEQFFDERPAHVSGLIDALLSDPAWGPRLAADAAGPRIGVLGHSAGGYTALALAGGRVATHAVERHCAVHAAQDPIFCGLPRRSTPGVAATSMADRRDPRVRAVAALAPLGAVFDPDSLRAVAVPVAVWVAQGDRFLAPRFHAEVVAAQVPGARLQRVALAGHFAFMDRPTVSLPAPDGDIASDPPGFDRAAFLARLGQELVSFFDATLPHRAGSPARASD